jgi:hypothetical protein
MSATPATATQSLGSFSGDRIDFINFIMKLINVVHGRKVAHFFFSAAQLIELLPAHAETYFLPQVDPLDPLAARIVKPGLTRPADPTPDFTGFASQNWERQNKAYEKEDEAIDSTKGLLLAALAESVLQSIGDDGRKHTVPGLTPLEIVRRLFAKFGELSQADIDNLKSTANRWTPSKSVEENLASRNEAHSILAGNKYEIADNTKKDELIAHMRGSNYGQIANQWLLSNPSAATRTYQSICSTYLQAAKDGSGESTVSNTLRAAHAATTPSAEIGAMVNSAVAAAVTTAFKTLGITKATGSGPATQSKTRFPISPYGARKNFCGGCGYNIDHVHSACPHRGETWDLGLDPTGLEALKAQRALARGIKTIPRA